MRLCCRYEVPSVSSTSIHFTLASHDCSMTNSPSDTLAAIPWWDVLVAFPGALAVYDATEQVVFCNDHYRSWFAATPTVLNPHHYYSGLISAHLAQGFIAEARGREAAWYQQHLVRFRNPPCQFEVKWTEQQWLQVFIEPLPEHHTLIVGLDVSTYSQFRSQLQAIEEALGPLPDAVVVTEAEPVTEPGPRIVFVNAAFTRYTGYTAEEAVGRSPRFLQGPDTDKAALARIRTALHNWQPVCEKVLNYTKSGHPFWIELDIAPLADITGHYTHWVAFQRPVKEGTPPSQPRFQELAPNTMWPWQYSLHTLAIDPTLIEFFGLPVSSRTTLQDLETHLPTEDRAKVRAQIGQALLNRQPFAVDIRVMRADSIPPVRHFEWLGEIRFTDTGKPQTLTGTAIDITDRNPVEIALALGEARIYTLIERLPVALCITDTQGLFVFVNTAHERLYGYSRTELLGQSFCRVVPVADQMRLRDLHDRFIAGTTELRGEWSVVDKSGQSLTVMTHAILITTADGAKKKVTFVMDVTHRKRAEETLQTFLEQLSTFIRASPMPIIALTADGIVQQWNPAAEQTFGWCAEEVRGQPLPNIPLGRRTEVEHLQQRIAQGETILGYETERLHRDGRLLNVLVTLVPMRDRQGLITSLYVIYMDVTESRAAQEALKQAKLEAERANQAKSDFLANISHEIRTPLTSIIGLADVMASSPLTDQQRSWLKTIQQSSDHLLHLINDLLDYSKIEANKLELESVVFSLPKLLDSIRASLQPLADRKNLKLTVKVPEDLPVRLYGDPLRLQQVLINLLHNAIKFTESGYVELRLMRRLCSDKTLCRLRFEVEDTGLGMTPETLKKLFSPFFQVDLSVSRKFGGSGLGLAICQRLVRMMGGAITVQSEVGQGSTFAFTLKFRIDEEQSGDRLTAAPFFAPNLDPLRHRTILVVEDYPPNQQVIELQLRSLGCEVQIAADGQQAIDRFEKSRFDAILMDIHMPHVDGLTATRRIRHYEQQQGLPPTPIIALTADIHARERERCIDAGMNDYLSKPFRKQAMAEVLMRWLNDKEQVHEIMPAVLEEPLSRLPVSDPDVEIRQALERLLDDLNPKGALSVLNTILMQIPTDLDRLLHALRTHEIEEASRIAHRLKGSARFYSNRRLGQLLQQVEDKMNHLNGQMAELIAIEYERVLRHIRAELERLSVWLAEEPENPPKRSDPV